MWDGWVLLQQHKICALGFVFTFLEVRSNFPYTHGFWSSLFREVVEYWGPADTGLLGDESSEGQWCMGSPPHSCGQNSQFLLLWLESYSFFQLCLQRIGAIRFALKMGKGRSDIKVLPLKLYWIKSNPLFKKFQTFGREFSFKNSSFF